MVTIVFGLDGCKFSANPNATPPNPNYGQVLAASIVPVPSATPSASPKADAVASGSTTKKAGRNSSALSANASHSADGMGFGIAAGGELGSLSPDAMNAELSDIKSLGATWVRFDMDWSNIGAAGPGQYNWSGYDQVVAAVAAHGLNSLAILDYTPGWAQESACAGSKMCAPADPNAYAQFAAAAVARYAPEGVHTWEIWNEPNNNNFFQPAANAAQYTSMLRAAYVAIKHVDPGATVLSGGLAPESSSGGNLSPPDFVNGMYASGARGYFDILGDHPYTWPYDPAYYMPGNAWDQMKTLHNIMVANGDGNKKIWITEYGAPTGGPGGQASSGFSTSEGGDDNVSEALQARMATDAVNVASSYGWVGNFFWYSYQDQGTSDDTVENFFGLLRADGSRKPSYYALQQAIASH